MKYGVSHVSITNNTADFIVRPAIDAAYELGVKATISGKEVKILAIGHVANSIYYVVAAHKAVTAHRVLQFLEDWTEVELDPAAEFTAASLKEMSDNFDRMVWLSPIKNRNLEHCLKGGFYTFATYCGISNVRSMGKIALEVAKGASTGTVAGDVLSIVGTAVNAYATCIAAKTAADEFRQIEW